MKRLAISPFFKKDVLHAILYQVKEGDRKNKKLYFSAHEQNFNCNWFSYVALGGDLEQLEDAWIKEAEEGEEVQLWEESE